MEMRRTSPLLNQKIQQLEQRAETNKLNDKGENKHNATIRLIMLAGKASPSPLLGQALGPYGINIMEFCKNFNNRTKNVKENVYVPIQIHFYTRDNYKILVKTPTTTFLVKQIANIAKGNPLPKKTIHLHKGFIKLKEIFHLALFKKCDKGSFLHYTDKHSLCKTLIGSIKSMGLNIKQG
jgi:large subunit ribosomal protein L11